MDEPSQGVRLGQMTRREFRTRIGDGSLQGCILPLAATEQHLEHLAMEHDWRSTLWIAERLASRLAPRVVVADALLVGISEHHMRHPGTLSLRPGTFLSVVADLLDSLTRAGLRNILVLNGHGGNVAPLQGVWDQLLRQTHANLHWLSYWDVLDAADAEALLTGGPAALPGHAQEFETSVALAAFPANVRLDAVADQPDHTPALGSADRGQQLLQRILDRLARYLDEMLSGHRTASIPDYFP